MFPTLENSQLIPKNEIKNYYNFLFYDGFYLDEKIRFTADGLPNMRPKKAFLSFYFSGTRYNKNLKLQAKEGAFIASAYLGANDEILIPFNSSGGRYGLKIYIFCWVQLPEEDIFNCCKRIEIDNFFTVGGLVPVKTLFFEAEKQIFNDSTNEQKSDKERPIKDINISSRVDYVENKEMKYKITLYDSGTYEVLNITRNTVLKPSPMSERIFNLSKFKEKEK